MLPSLKDTPCLIQKLNMHGVPLTVNSFQKVTSTTQGDRVLKNLNSPTAIVTCLFELLRHRLAGLFLCKADA